MDSITEVFVQIFPQPLKIQEILSNIKNVYSFNNIKFTV